LRHVIGLWDAYMNLRTKVVMYGCNTFIFSYLRNILCMLWIWACQ
jgi:hypothetical protein